MAMPVGLIEDEAHHGQLLSNLLPAVVDYGGPQRRRWGYGDFLPLGVN